MYDINKRKQLKTVGELKEILKNIPDDTQVLICGEDYAWFHIEQDGSVICLDNEDLECCYEDTDETIEMKKEFEGIGNTIFTHDEATRIVEMFEDILSEHNIHIPSLEDDEREPDNMAALYGTTYSNLLDRVEEILINIAVSCRQGSDIIEHEFSGNY